MSRLETKQLELRIGQRGILHDISIQIETGEVICILGPSGVGKTSLLRLLAGFLQPSAGEIFFQGKKIADANYSLPVEQRRLGMVFQDYALFPHLNVKQNIYFGIQDQTPEQQQQRLQQLIELLSMHDFIEQYPHQLSGGQQQRVAIARALAPNPDVLLLDEPFASLDIELREQLAKELRNVLKQAGVTTLMVCHNQSEAFVMADRIAVMNQGRVVQLDKPFNIYHQPHDEFIATFIGEGIFINGKVVDDQTIDSTLGLIHGNPHGHLMGTSVQVLLRPDDILHDDHSSLQAVVVEKLFRGSSFLYTLELGNGEQVLSLVPSHHDHRIGESIGIRLEIDHLVAFQNAE